MEIDIYKLVSNVRHNVNKFNLRTLQILLPKAHLAILQFRKKNPYG